MTALAPLLTAFLREHLPRERNASPHTIATYAHAFALLVRFAAGRLKRRPSDLSVEEIDPDLVLAFLDHVEGERGNAARSRNARFAAIRSFFRYLEYKAPACLEQALRIRALPMKRSDKALIDYLTLEEVKELLSAPDPRSWGGVRDRAMLHLTYAAGLRVSELLSLRLDDFSDRSLSMVRILGKGRRERVLPLWRETQAALRAWIVVRPQASTPELFLSRNGERMSRDGFAHRLALHVATATRKRPALSGKRVTPHVLRHSCAMHTLAATGDVRKVSLWLGHASLQSTEAYLRADPADKLAVLAAHAPPAIKQGRFRPPSDKLMAVLTELRNAT
ncbi:tyrosine-type recombinase/integrase (plasmid) [Rhizobium sp. CB3090]|uniref:tyrosine-type recombinase/integrase n=1 Tax=Rhizobium sp. CB3090 TaxID=3039156 RepID=UPI0024B1ED2E|nr:tyrosine-type recombinase/integrase [Rhizobium sp. CB3090]WFU13337.1 tyrosine-type recombinase/integrase [Rhizobium sp. CB3090]